MATESTVLLVHTHEPPQHLSDELEKQGLFVELALTAEVEHALTVVGPDLLVHCGAAGAAETVAMLAKKPRPRVRLALVVERASIEEMRKLDRSVVTTVLPDDLAHEKLVERIAALANRGTAQASVVPKPTAPKPTTPTAASPTPGSPTPATAARPAPGGRAVLPPAPAAVPLPTPAPAPVPTPSPAKVMPKLQPAKRASGRRVALVDDDVTRAEAVALVLRERGFDVHSSPADPARTRWLLLRRFAPEIVVTDSARPPQNWLTHLLADEQLKGAQWIAAPYLRMFDETSGAVNVAPLLERVERNSSPPAARPAGDDEDDNRPTLVADEEDEDRPTLVVDDSHRAELAAAVEARRSLADTPRIAGAYDASDDAPESLPAESIDPDSLDEPSPESEPEIEDLDALIAEPLPLEDVMSGKHANVPQMPKVAPVLAGNRSVETIDAVVRTSVPGAPPLLDPPRSKGKLVAVLLGGALIAGGGGFYWQQKARAEAAPVAAAPQERSATEHAAGPPPSASAQSAKPEATAASAAPSASAATPSAVDNPWLAQEDTSVPRCERQGEYAELPEDAAQASRMLDKARSVLVLGDWTKARDLMCRAVLMDPKSLALEGLAESYLALHAPAQAKHWIELARAERPARPRTLELCADIENQLGETEQSRTDWTKALGVPAADQKTLDFVASNQVSEGTTAFRGKDFGRAELLYRRAATISPTNASAPAGLARTMLALGKSAQAASWVALAAERSATNNDVLVAQGDLAQSRGDTAAARASYEAAIKANPAHYIAREQLAKLKD